MDILLLTNEYPPHVYGGAGVHVAHLSRELARIGNNRVRVFSFGDQDSHEPGLEVSGVAGAEIPAADPRHARLLDALQRNIRMVGMAGQADIIHCHTWYSYLAGLLLKHIHDIPLIATTHSLEPHRPWKREQLGGGYDGVRWLEHTAMTEADGIIAVSRAMKDDTMELFGVAENRVEVIYNGIDTERYRKVEDPDVLRRYGVDPALPFVLFVGRITRQKGILHLVRALAALDDGMQVVLCAGMADTEAIGAEMQQAVEAARRQSNNAIVWVERMVPVADIIALYSHAALFVCPSVYEPFGIINLEAMACDTPVVAAAVGGIPEVVVADVTGLLVPFAPRGGGDPEPRDPEAYAHDLAQAINSLMASADRRAAMARASRQRVEEHFSWRSIADRTQSFYREVIARHRQLRMTR